MLRRSTNWRSDRPCGGGIVSFSAESLVHFGKETGDGTLPSSAHKISFSHLSYQNKTLFTVYCIDVQNMIVQL